MTGIQAVEWGIALSVVLIAITDVIPPKKKRRKTKRKK